MIIATFGLIEWYFCKGYDIRRHKSQQGLPENSFLHVTNNRVKLKTRQEFPILGLDDLCQEKKRAEERSGRRKKKKRILIEFEIQRNGMERRSKHFSGKSFKQN